MTVNLPPDIAAGALAATEAAAIASYRGIGRGDE